MTIHSDERTDGLVLCHQEERWLTTAVTPLVGWYNVFRTPEGHWITEPCPVLLTQETTVTLEYYAFDPLASRFDAMMVTETPHDRRVRVVFAEHNSAIPCSSLDPAGDDEEPWTRQYRTTLPADEATAFIEKRCGGFIPEAK
jgi:hypothetical protein